MPDGVKRVLSVVLLALLGTATGAAQLREGKFGIGLSIAGNRMASDLPTNEFNVGASVDYTYAILEHWSLRGGVAFDGLKGKTAAGETIMSPVISATAVLAYDLMPHPHLNPFGFLGVSLLYLNPVKNQSQALIGPSDQPWDAAIVGGIGLDYFVDPIWSITVQVRMASMLKDKLEGIRGGSARDAFGAIQVGFRYYLYDYFFLRKILSPAKQE